jgi:hypothetical protein
VKSRRSADDKIAKSASLPMVTSERLKFRLAFDLAFGERGWGRVDLLAAELLVAEENGGFKLVGERQSAKSTAARGDMAESDELMAAA